MGNVVLKQRMMIFFFFFFFSLIKIPESWCLIRASGKVILREFNFEGEPSSWLPRISKDEESGWVVSVCGCVCV